MPGTGLLRGRVYAAELPHIEGQKYYLVVSNNRRNGAFDQVLAVRLTTTPPRSPRPAVVQLGNSEVFTGWVCCDDIETIWADEVRRELGALSPRAMARVEDGLRAALDL